VKFIFYRCRKGAAEILVNYDDLCPSGNCSYEKSGGNDTLGNFPICGKDVPRGYYVSASNRLYYCFPVYPH